MSLHPLFWLSHDACWLSDLAALMLEADVDSLLLSLLPLTSTPPKLTTIPPLPHSLSLSVLPRLRIGFITIPPLSEPPRLLTELCDDDGCRSDELVLIV
jgi:hypothetical protein